MHVYNDYRNNIIYSVYCDGKHKWNYDFWNYITDTSGTYK